MGADGDDEVGALVVGKEHRDVLARARGGEGDAVAAEGLDPLRARRVSVAVGVDDDLRARGERGVGHGVHVADDHVRLVAGFEDRIGAAVDADERPAGTRGCRRRGSRGPLCSGSRGRR